MSAPLLDGARLAKPGSPSRRRQWASSTNRCTSLAQIGRATPFQCASVPVRKAVPADARPGCPNESDGETAAKRESSNSGWGAGKLPRAQPRFLKTRSGAMLVNVYTRRGTFKPLGRRTLETGLNCQSLSNALTRTCHAKASRQKNTQGAKLKRSEE